MPLAPKQLLFPLLAFARRYRAGLVISGTTCLASLALYTALYLVPHPSRVLEFLADIELKTLDLRFLLRGPRQPSQSVVIVAIDQKSQDVLGRWPFPRRHLAEAVNFLREAQARVIVFDINFPQPDQNSALQSLRQVRQEYETRPGLRDQGFDAQLRRLEAEADNDQRLAEALSKFDKAILGYFFLPREETRTQNPARVKEFLNYLSFQAYPQQIHPEYGKRFEGLEAGGVSPNLPRFAQYAKNFGYFNVIPDPDGTVRREPVIIRFQGSYYPSLDVAAVLAYTNRPLEQIAIVFNRNGLERVDFGRAAIPTDSAGYVQIDFYGPAGTFPAYSLADVVQRKLPKDLFRDRLVLIGPTATGIADLVATPFQEVAFPGVEVHANFIENMLEGHFIRRGLRESLIDIAFILLFSLAAGSLLSVARPLTATAILLLALGLYLWLGYYSFKHYRIWVATLLPMAALTINYAGIVSYRFFSEEREKKRVRDVFGQYVAPSVIKQLLARPELVTLGGEERELTAMFCDIRGFTSIAEALSPSALVLLLNEYFSEMTEVIFRYYGTLDKYIGDAVMAFWGAPYPQPDHAERACYAALEMLRRLRALDTRWEAEGRPPLDAGVGIHTGPMLVGNLGSARRFNYTIMGDNVNLAARLQDLNRQFGTRLIVSESTYLAVRDKLVTRELDLIRVKGKRVPVKIYEVLGRSEQLDQFRELLGRFHRALETYRHGRWEAALELFEEVLRNFPDDGPSQIFLQRCRDLVERPPLSEWDGVYVMGSK